jgi:hypothetical protein
VAAASAFLAARPAVHADASTAIAQVSATLITLTGDGGERRAVGAPWRSLIPGDFTADPIICGSLTADRSPLPPKSARHAVAAPLAAANLAQMAMHVTNAVMVGHRARYRSPRASSGRACSTLLMTSQVLTGGALAAHAIGADDHPTSAGSPRQADRVRRCSPPRSSRSSPRSGARRARCDPELVADTASICVRSPGALRLSRLCRLRLLVAAFRARA